MFSLSYIVKQVLGHPLSDSGKLKNDEITTLSGKTGAIGCVVAEKGQLLSNRFIESRSNMP